MTETKNYIFNDLIGNLHTTTNLSVVGSSNDDDIANNRTVTYNSGKYGKIYSGNSSEVVIKGQYPKNPPTISADEGYQFIGWSYTEDGQAIDLSKEIIEVNTTYYAKYIAIEEIKVAINPEYKGAYLKGYTDKTFKPNNNMTRAEFSSMISNILTIPENLQSVNFKDVSADKWYADDIKLVAGAGLINGYNDGTFKPANMITRAEATSIIIRMLDLPKVNSINKFPDINGHWAYNDIVAASTAGLVDGYTDGTFKPEGYITRAEVTKIINNLLGRKPINDTSLNKFLDVKTEHWAFGEIISATSENDIIKKSSK